MKKRGVRTMSKNHASVAHSRSSATIRGNVGELDATAQAAAEDAGATAMIDAESEESLREALAHYGDDPVLLGNLGRLLRKRGDTEEAIEIYRKACEQEEAPAAVWFNLAQAEYDEGRTEAALKALDRALELDPALAIIRLLRARCLTRMERLEEARDAYLMVLQADGTDFNAWLELGNVFRRLGQDRQARDSYGRAVQSRPEDNRGYLAGARAMEAMGAVDEAACYYHRALERCGGKPEELVKLYHRIARFRLDDGNPAWALESLRQALLVAQLGSDQVEPDQVEEIHIDLGEALMRLGLEQEAFRAFERASMAEAEAVLLRLAETSYRFNQWEAGVEVLRSNVALHPESLLARTLPLNQWVRSHHNILVSGPTGAGKSYLACALGQKACRNGYATLYQRVPRLLQEIAVARLDGRYAKLLVPLIKCEVLKLDDRLQANRRGKRGRFARSKLRNLLERFQKFEVEVLRFFEDSMVPFFSNQAENDLPPPPL